MTLLALGSLKGAPGVTTTALALGAVWPGEGRVVVAECDPGGGDLAAWYGLASEPGLVSLAAAARHVGGIELLEKHCQQLPGGLPVLAAPVADEQAAGALRLLPGELLAEAAKDPRVLVVADCGRLHPATPAAPLLAATELLLVVCRPEPADLAHVAAALPRLRAQARALGLVLVGEGAYRDVEIGAALRVEVLGGLPVDRRAARVLAGGAARSSGLRHTPLLRGARTLAEAIGTRLRADDGPVTGTGPVTQAAAGPAAWPAGGR